MTLTARQRDFLIAYVELGSQKEAAQRCGCALSTLKNTLHVLYQREDCNGVAQLVWKLRAELGAQDYAPESVAPVAP